MRKGVKVRHKNSKLVKGTTVTGNVKIQGIDMVLVDWEGPVPYKSYIHTRLLKEVRRK